MADDAQQSELPAARVATRPGVSGVAAMRRRIFQRHLLLFAAACASLLAFDNYTSPGIQWAHFMLVPWGLIFLLHTLGLKSRGYTVGEMLIPPKQKPVKKVYTVPLDYELVRARQLRDGIFRAAGALGDRTLADRAVAASDDLVQAVEAVVTSSRAGSQATDGQVPEAQAALAALNDLHVGILRREVQADSESPLPIEAVEERAKLLASH